MSVGALAVIVKKCRSMKKNPEAVLAIVHPVLMENIRVDSSGVMRLRSKKYHWERGSGWRQA